MFYRDFLKERSQGRSSSVHKKFTRMCDYNKSILVKRVVKGGIDHVSRKINFSHFAKNKFGKSRFTATIEITIREKK